MTQLTNGMRATFAHPDFGHMTGTILAEFGETVFLPDEEFHDELYYTHGIDGESGLFLTGGDVAPL